MKALSKLFISLCTISTVVKANQWDEGFDADLKGDSPFPDATPLVPANLYLLPGTVVPHRQTGGSKDAMRRQTGRLDYKRDAACADPTYTLVCPITENLPCCPPGYTVCCHDPSDICCEPGYFCVGTTGCCADGTTACGTEHCCPSGSTCCNGEACCASGYVCQDNQCFNPQLSIQSTASVQSVSSVASIQSQSFASVQSLSAAGAVTLSQISLQSVSSELAGQNHNGADPNSITTAQVLPSDPRIDYKPSSSWTDTSSESGVGSCTNGTRVTTQQNANFTFVFAGTDISLYIVPSALGGTFTVQIDGGQASTFNSQGTVTGGCIPAQVFTKSDLTDNAHELTVKNGGGVTGSDAGTLEFNSIIYTGKGAFGTSTSPSKKNNSAVIGGSVGGVVGAVVLVGAGILFFLYRKKQQRNSTTATPATPNQPMMYQQQPGSPYSPGSQPPLTPPSQPPGSPNMSQAYGTSVYSGMQPGPQPGGAPQQGWGGYQADPNSRPASGFSGAGAAPIPMWVERARTSQRDDATSLTSDNSGLPPGAQPGVNPLYGNYHPANAQSWNGSR